MPANGFVRAQNKCEIRKYVTNLVTRLRLRPQEIWERDILLFWCYWFKYRYIKLDLVTVGKFHSYFSRILGSIVDCFNVNPARAWRLNHALRDWKNVCALTKIGGEERSMATSHTLLGFNYWFKPLIALTPTVPAFLQNKVWLSNNTSRKLLFCSVQWTKVLTVNSCFQCFIQTLFGNTFILHQPQWTVFLVSRDRC